MVDGGNPVHRLRSERDRHRFRSSAPRARGSPGPVIEARWSDLAPVEIFRVPFGTEAGCRSFAVDLTEFIGSAGVPPSSPIRLLRR